MARPSGAHHPERWEGEEWAQWRVHLRVRKTIYDKSIYGSSDALPLILRECLSQGLVTREAVQKSPSRRDIAHVLERVIRHR